MTVEEANRHINEIRDKILEYYADHGITPFTVTRFIPNHNGKTYVYVKELPSNIPAKVWLSQLKESIEPEHYERVFLTGACTLISVAVGLAICDHTKLLRVTVAMEPKRMLKVYAPAYIEPENVELRDIDDLWSDHHHVLLRKIDGEDYVLDLTGVQYGWHEDVLGRWVKLSHYTEVTKVTYDLQKAHYPFEFINRKGMTGEQKDHVEAVLKIAYKLLET